MKLTSRQHFLLAFLAFSLLVTLALVLYPQEKIVKQATNLRSLAPIPVLKNQNQDVEKLWQAVEISAPSAYAIDLKSATVLYQKDQYQALYPASTIKILTALVARDYYQLEQSLTVDGQTDVLGNTLDFYAGEELLVKDLLAALLVFSANDAAYVLADNYPGGLPAFLLAMKQKASDLHLKNTYFLNPAGLDEEAQVLSAYDLVILAKELLQDDYLRQLVATPYLSINSLNQDALGQPIWQHQVYSSNQLLLNLAGVKGVKTGTTDLAGQVLVTLIEREGREILIALMKSEDRYSDTEKLIAWILNNYQWSEFEPYLLY